MLRQRRALTTLRCQLRGFIFHAAPMQWRAVQWNSGWPHAINQCRAAQGLEQQAEVHTSHQRIANKCDGVKPAHTGTALSTRRPI